jgi:hypothetical protein
VEKSDICLIPKISNANIDKSLETIHKTIMRNLRKYSNKDRSALTNALPLYEEYNKTIKNLWS